MLKLTIIPSGVIYLFSQRGGAGGRVKPHPLTDISLFQSPPPHALEIGERHIPSLKIKVKGGFSGQKIKEVKVPLPFCLKRDTF